MVREKQFSARKTVYLKAELEDHAELNGELPCKKVREG